MKYIQDLMEMACNKILRSKSKILRSKSKVKTKQNGDERIKFYKICFLTCKFPMYSNLKYDPGCEPT